MIAVNDDLMSDHSFLEWVKDKNYLLWQTGFKEQFRLKIERTEYLVTGLHKTVRKGLNIATAHGYYELEPVLADKWEPLTIEEFGALKPGDRVHVLQRCGMIQGMRPERVWTRHAGIENGPLFRARKAAEIVCFGLELFL